MRNQEERYFSINVSLFTYDFFVQDMEPDANSECNDEGVLVTEEEKEVGVVSISVYKAYYVAVGYIMAPAILLALFLMQG